MIYFNIDQINHILFNETVISEIESFTPINEKYMVQGFQIPSLCNPNCSWYILVVTSEKISYIRGTYDHNDDKLIQKSITERGINGNGYWTDERWSNLWKLADDDLMNSLYAKNEINSCIIIPNKECKLELGDTRGDTLQWMEISTGDTIKKNEYGTSKYTTTEQGIRQYQWMDASGKKITKVIQSPYMGSKLSPLEQEFQHMINQISGSLND